MRVFPLSNWTELDIWQYIYREISTYRLSTCLRNVPSLSATASLLWSTMTGYRLSLAKCLWRRWCAFRTLGCYPLTGAVESEAVTLPDVIQEMLLTTTSERQGRVIDSDAGASWSRKSRKVTSKMADTDTLLETDILAYLQRP